MNAKMLLETQIATLQSSIAKRRADINELTELAAKAGKTTNTTLRKLHKAQYAERKLMKEKQEQFNFWFNYGVVTVDPVVLNKED